MSLQTRLAALATAIGTDIKDLRDDLDAISEDQVLNEQTWEFSAATGTLLNTSTIDGIAINGDVDVGYEIEVRGDIASGANQEIRLYPNNLSANRNQETAYWYRDGGSVQNPLNSTFDTSPWCICRMHFGVAAAFVQGRARFYAKRRNHQMRYIVSDYFNAVDSDTFFRGHLDGTWLDGVTNVTSLVFVLTGGNFTGEIVVRRLVAPQQILIPGPAGEDGAMGPAGDWTFIPGEWQDDVEYDEHNVIRYEDSLWFATDTPGVGDPPGEDIIIPGEPPDPPTLDTVPSVWVTGSDPLLTNFRIEDTDPLRSPTYFGSSVAVKAIAFETDGTVVAGDYINLRVEGWGSSSGKLLADAPAGSDPVYETGDYSNINNSGSYQAFQLAANRRYILILGSQTDFGEWDIFFTSPAKIKDMSEETGEPTILPSLWEIFLPAVPGPQGEDGEDGEDGADATADSMGWQPLTVREEGGFTADEDDPPMWKLTTDGLIVLRGKAIATALDAMDFWDPPEFLIPLTIHTMVAGVNQTQGEVGVWHPVGTALNWTGPKTVGDVLGLDGIIYPSSVDGPLGKKATPTLLGDWASDPTDPLEVWEANGELRFFGSIIGTMPASGTVSLFSVAGLPSHARTIHGRMDSQTISGPSHPELYGIADFQQHVSNAGVISVDSVHDPGPNVTQVTFFGGYTKAV